MNNAIIISLFASFLWAMTNHIDKFMISGEKESKNSVKILLMFSTLLSGLVLSPIWLITNDFSISIGIVSLITVFFAAIIYVLATFLYFKALEKRDASIIVVMFQLIPVFSYILAFVLFKENLALKQIIGSIIIILSAVIISFNFEEKNNKNNIFSLLLMLLSSLLYATYFILFDFAIRQSPFNSCAFWYQISFIIIGIFLLFIKSFRKPFIQAIKKNGKKYISLNIINEVLNLGSNLLVNYANVTISIAIVNVLNGFQGAFVFILGILGTYLIPKYFKEDLRKSVIIQKIGCILLSIIGLIVMLIK